MATANVTVMIHGLDILTAQLKEAVAAINTLQLQLRQMQEEIHVSNHSGEFHLADCQLCRDEFAAQEMSSEGQLYS